MKSADQLSEFVGKALTAGRNRDEIAAALRSANWQETEISRALASWSDTPFTPPIPRPRNLVSARDALFYGLLFTALLMTVLHVNFLGFELIDLAFLAPDDTSYGSEWRADSIRWSISVLVVVVPFFLWLNHRQNIQLKTDPSKARSPLRKWFASVTQFLAIFSLVGDVIFTVYALLSGDVTAEFLLKAALVAATTLLVLLYFRKEWMTSDAA